MRSDLFSADNLEKESAQPGLRLQNSKLLKAELNGEFMARVGSMVAYQGQVQFEALGSGGIGKFIKQKLTGEGVPLMRVRGNGDVFLADRAADIHLIDLEPGDALSINGSNVLAFDSSLSYDIKMVGGAVGEEHVTLAADPHQRHALAGELLLQELADAAGTKRLELHLALVRDHRADPGHELAVQLRLEQFGVLQPQAGLGRLLLEVLGGKKIAAH